jgi:hypothetical protein|nr:MAG TPA: hypothetical protein [Caudoviricetes sp.]
MNKTILALSLALIAGSAYATNTPGADCVGVNACKTNSDNRTTNTSNAPVASVNGVNPEAHAQQQQGQQQGQTATGGSVGGVNVAPQTSLATGGYSYNNKSLYIQPVTVPAAAMVAPSAEISRVADPYCGPRQKVMSTDVSGRVIGLMWNSNVPLGENQWLAPDLDEPYRRVEVIPGQLTQLIGHKVHETTTVLTVSTSGALAFGANGSGGAGGSIGASRGGALQRMVTTIRVQECVAYEIVPKQAELPKVKPQPKRKPQPKPQPKPQCDVCLRPQVNLTVNVSK